MVRITIAATVGGPGKTMRFAEHFGSFYGRSAFDSWEHLRLHCTNILQSIVPSKGLTACVLRNQVAPMTDQLTILALTNRFSSNNRKASPGGVSHAALRRFSGQSADSVFSPEHFNRGSR